MDEVVLSWKVGDIKDEKLFTKDLVPIPNHFATYTQWKQIFKPYILEELRASLMGCLLKEIYSLKINIVKRSKQTIGFKFHDTQTFETMDALSGTLAIVTSEAASRQISEIENHSHVIVKLFMKDDELNMEFSPSLEAKEIVSAENCNLFLLEEPYIPSSRVYDSLENADLYQPYFMNDVLLGKHATEFTGYEKLANFTEYNDTNDLENLNTSKKTAAFSAFNVKIYDQEQIMKSNGCIELIHGPPGTGKSTTLIQIIRGLHRAGLRVNVTAPTNDAVKVLALKFLESFDNEKSVCRKYPQGFDFGDFLLTGRPAKLSIDAFDPLANIHLDFRCEKLQILRQKYSESSNKVRRYFLYDGIFQEYNLVIDSKLDLKISLDSVQSFPGFFKENFKGHLIEYLSICHEIVIESPLPIDENKRFFVFNAIENIEKVIMKIIQIPDITLQKWYESNANNTIDIEDQETNFRHLYSLFKQEMSKIPNFEFTAAALSTSNLKKLTARRAKVLFSTVSGAGSRSLRELEFDICIIDEASQLVEAATVLVLKPNLKRLILAGDYQQLPATVKSMIASQNMYGRSLFERLIKDNKYPSILLDTQYRMHPDIVKWPNKTFYDKKIQNGENVINLNFDWYKSYGPFTVIDTCNSVTSEESDDVGSKRNLYEVDILKCINNNFKKLFFEENSKRSFSVGLLTPYKGQVSLLKETLNYPTVKPSASDTVTLFESHSVHISSIDGCQGQEYDVVIFSAVRSNTLGKVGFLKDSRRLNVAITRARYSLILVCDSRTVSHDPLWRDLLDVAHNRNCIVMANEFKGIEKVNKVWQRKDNAIRKLLTAGTSLFESSIWKFVSIASEFRETFLKIPASETKIREEIMRQLLLLANGKRPELKSNHNLIKKEFSSILFVKSIRQWTVVYSIDIRRSTSYDTQCIKLWNLILNQHQSLLDKCLNQIQVGLSLYTPEYLEECRATLIENQVVLPISKVHDSSIKLFKSLNTVKANETKSAGNDKDCSILKFYPLSSNVARILIKSTDMKNIDLPFEMSLEEEEIVNFQGSLLIVGRSGTGKTTVMLYRMLKEQLIYEQCEEMDSHLLVTASSVLCAAIAENYEKLLNASNVKNNQDNPHTLRVSPSIVTYRAFIDQLDSYLNTPFFIGEQCDTSKSILKREITFETFSYYIYPSFSDVLTSKYDCCSIYAEIMSHIKGSIDAATSINGYLSIEQYIDIGKSRSYGGCIDTKYRELIYKEGFEKYERIKNEKFLYDILDYVHHVYSHLQKGNLQKNKHLPSYSGVFVDEVQDLSPAQLMLFHFVCRNPYGFVFAGDTAQTITPGVGFRFESLKDIFYQVYLHGDSEETKKQRMPILKQLTKNFRTHNSILNLASNIVSILYNFFPYSIDKLSPETSLNFGPKPIVLEGNVDIASDLFIDDRNDNDKSSVPSKSITFGAEQVILVRDEETKRQVLRISQDKALVLTVLECKGMEFEDCLVMDFFSSSPLQNEWRVLYNTADSSECIDVKRPNFDPQKHSLLNNELKMLYVLATRTKSRLIISDRDTTARKPIFDLWNSKMLVESRPFDQDIKALFNNKSSPLEWKLKGDSFFSKNQYQNAKFCYIKCDDVNLINKATAYEMEQEGDKILIKDKHLANSHYKSAANLFFNLNMIDKTAECYEKAEEYSTAAVHYENILLWENAGYCYEKANDFGKAAAAYWKINKLSKAIEACYCGSLYKTAIEYLLDFKNRNNRMRYDEVDTIENEKINDIGNVSESDSIDIDAMITESSKKGARHCHLRKKSSEMMFFVNLFSTTSQKINFLASLHYWKEVIEIEIECKNYLKVGSLYLQLFDYESAAKYYKMVGNTNMFKKAIYLHYKSNNCDENFLCVLSKEKSNELMHSLGLPLLEKNVNIRDYLKSVRKQVNDLELYLLSLSSIYHLTDVELIIELARDELNNQFKPVQHNKSTQSSLKSSDEIPLSCQLFIISFAIACTLKLYPTEDTAKKQNTPIRNKEVKVDAYAKNLDVSYRKVLLEQFQILQSKVSEVLSHLTICEDGESLSPKNASVIVELIKYFNGSLVSESYLRHQSKINFKVTKGTEANFTDRESIQISDDGVSLTMTVLTFSKQAAKFFKDQVESLAIRVYSIFYKYFEGVDKFNNLGEVTKLNHSYWNTASSKREKLDFKSKDTIEIILGLNKVSSSISGIKECNRLDLLFDIFTLHNVDFTNLDEVIIFRNNDQDLCKYLIQYNNQMNFQSCLKYNYIFSSCLLLSLSENADNIKMLRNRCENELINRLRRVETEPNHSHRCVSSDSRHLLVKAFIWEITSAKATENYVNFSNCYEQSLNIGIYALQQELRYGNLSKLLFSSSIEQKSLYQYDDGVLHPHTLITVLEKYTVLCLFDLKGFSNVFMTSKLAKSELTSRNKMCAERFKQLTGFEIENEIQVEIKQTATHRLNKLTTIMNDLLFNCNIDSWFAACALPKSKDETRSYLVRNIIRRITQLLSIVLMNRINKQDLFINFKMLLQRSKNSLSMGQPIHFSNFISTIFRSPNEFMIRFMEYCKQMDDPVLLLEFNESNDVWSRIPTMCYGNIGRRLLHLECEEGCEKSIFVISSPLSMVKMKSTFNTVSSNNSSGNVRSIPTSIIKKGFLNAPTSKSSTSSGDKSDSSESVDKFLGENDPQKNLVNGKSVQITDDWIEVDNGNGREEELIDVDAPPEVVAVKCIHPSRRITTKLINLARIAKENWKKMTDFDKFCRLRELDLIQKSLPRFHVISKLYIDRICVKLFQLEQKLEMCENEVNRLQKEENKLNSKNSKNRNNGQKGNNASNAPQDHSEKILTLNEEIYLIQNAMAALTVENVKSLLEDDMKLNNDDLENENQREIKMNHKIDILLSNL